MDSLTIPLYHGTSTIFLNGIVESGLGGRNPIAEWKVLDFAKALLPYVREHLSKDEGWMAKAQTFGFMVEQQSTSMNFQHGDSYLSPSKSTAIRYAVNKRYGSELLTYALEFLDELIRRKVPGVSDDLYRRFPHIYRFLNISCAPVLVEVHHASPIDLVDERGGDALHNLREIEKLLAERGEMDEVLLQQTNFRLRRAVPPSELTFWLINVSQWHPFQPDYTLHLISIPGANNNI